MATASAILQKSHLSIIGTLACQILTNYPSPRAGSAAVKYGSLLFDTPFQPDLSLALLIIAAPCILFAIFLSIESRQQEDAPPL